MKTLFEAIHDEERQVREQDTFDVLCYGTCRCGNVGCPEESCPYSADIYNDPNDFCNCCDVCRRNCADDI